MDIALNAECVYHHPTLTVEGLLFSLHRVVLTPTFDLITYRDHPQPTLDHISNLYLASIYCECISVLQPCLELDYISHL